MSERVIEVKRALIDRAAGKIRDGKVSTVARYSAPDGEIIAFEYYSDDDKCDKLMIFQETGHELIIHHPEPCKAFKQEKPNCWHIGLYGVYAGLKTYEGKVRAIAEPDVSDFLEDLTPTVASRVGVFRFLPSGATPSAVSSIPEEEELIIPVEESAVLEAPTSKKRKPRKVAAETEQEVPTIEDPLKELLESYKIEGHLQEAVLELRERNLATLSAAEKLMVPNPFDHLFFPTGAEVRLGLMSLAKQTWEPYLLTGSKGTGKSNLARLICGFLGIPVVSINGNAEMGQEVLLGSNTLEYYETMDKSEEAKVRYALLRADLENSLKERIINALSETKAHVVLQEGALLQCTRRGYALLIEEINVLPPDVQISMNMLLDKHRSIYVPGKGTETPHERFRLLGTMNPGYMGTNELAPSFRDRFIRADVEHMSEKAFSALMLRYNPSKQVAEDLTKVYVAIKDRVLGAGSTLPEEVLSIRDLARVAEAHAEFGGELRDWGRQIILSSITDERSKKSVQDIIELLHG